MTDDTTCDAIERYLLGQMPDDERTAFEAQLAADPVLAAQFARQQREHTALQVLVDDHLRAKLNDWKKQYPLRDSFLHRYRIPLGIGGLLLLAALWSVLPFGQKKEPDAPKKSHQPTEQPIAQTTPPIPAPDTPADTPPSPPQKLPARPPQYLALAAELREPARFPTDNLRHDDDTLDVLDSALLDLSERRFGQGLARLRAIPPEHPRYPDVPYFQGLAHYEQGAFGKAVPFLKNAANTPAYLYAEQAEWYLTLAYLHLGQIKSCQARARQIAADDGHTYREQAQKLLARMRKIELQSD